MQLVGVRVRETQNFQKKVGHKKVGASEKCPWGKSLTNPVPNNSLNTAF